MRRAVLIVLVFVALVALDATFNDYRVSGAVYREFVEFGRLVNRTIDAAF